jgi:hypothetical protein
MERATLVQPREVSKVVGHEYHAVADGMARDVLVTGGPQIDLVDMKSMEAPATCKSHETGAQVLIDQDPELAGLQPGFFFKA